MKISFLLEKFSDHPEITSTLRKMDSKIFIQPMACTS